MITELAETQDLPLTTELSLGEQFVLWAFRTRLASEQRSNSQLVQGFRLSFGLARLEEALKLFEDAFKHLQQNLCCDIHFACKCRRQVTSDEVCIISLFSACQHEAFYDARYLAGTLVHDTAQSSLIGKVTGLTAIMREADLSLPEPYAQETRPPTRGEEVAALTIH